MNSLIEMTQYRVINLCGLELIVKHTKRHNRGCDSQAPHYVEAARNSSVEALRVYLTNNAKPTISAFTDSHARFYWDKLAYDLWVERWYVDPPSALALWRELTDDEQSQLIAISNLNRFNLELELAKLEKTQSRAHKKARLFAGRLRAARACKDENVGAKLLKPIIAWLYNNDKTVEVKRLALEPYLCKSGKDNWIADEGLGQISRFILADYCMNDGESVFVNGNLGLKKWSEVTRDLSDLLDDPDYCWRTQNHVDLTSGVKLERVALSLAVYPGEFYSLREFAKELKAQEFVFIELEVEDASYGHITLNASHAKLDKALVEWDTMVNLFGSVFQGALHL